MLHSCAINNKKISKLYYYNKELRRRNKNLNIKQFKNIEIYRPSFRHY